jgi:hypothetical protein
MSGCPAYPVGSDALEPTAMKLGTLSASVNRSISNRGVKSFSNPHSRAIKKIFVTPGFGGPKVAQKESSNVNRGALKPGSIKASPGVLPGVRQPRSELLVGGTPGPSPRDLVTPPIWSRFVTPDHARERQAPTPDTPRGYVRLAGTLMYATPPPKITRTNGVRAWFRGIKCHIGCRVEGGVELRTPPERSKTGSQERFQAIKSRFV